MSLVQSAWFAHGGLQVQNLYVLPVFLEERNQEIDRKLQILENLGFGHTTVSHRCVQAKHFLQLELDGSLHLVDLSGKILLLLHDTREFTRLVEAGAKQTRDLLDQALRSDEVLVLLGELLDELLVFIKVLETIGILEVNTQRRCLLTVEGIPENANAHLWTRNMGQLDAASETLVFLGIVVLQTDLKLDGLNKPTLLLLSASEDSTDDLLHVVG